MSLKKSIKNSPLYPIALPTVTTVKSLLKLPKKLYVQQQPKAIVLLYHRVTSLDRDPQALAVSPDNFKKHLTHLAKQYHVISSDALAACLTKQSIPDQSIVLTFDDGYEDNFLNAYPALRAAKFPATIFVAGIGNQTHEFWWDELDQLFDTSDSHYRELHVTLKKMLPEKREETLNILFNKSDKPRVTRKAFQQCTAQQLNTMIDSGLITIGGHTVHHCQLSALPPAEQEKEITENLNYISSLHSQPLIPFAYPFGNTVDFNGTTVKIIKKYFPIAFANYKGQILKSTDHYRLPRFVIKNWDEQTFANKINDFFTFV